MRFIARALVALSLLAAPASALALGSVPALAQAPAPTTQNTVTTTGPVSSTTTIEAGTIGGEVLKWVAAVAGGTVGIVVTGWISRLFKLAGLQITDTMLAKLQSMIVNGLNAGAKIEAQNLQGKARIEIKDAIIGHAVEYVQEHGADTMKALGFDPTSPQAVSAIKARIETALADPTQPTPAIITPAPVAPAARL